MLVRITAMPRYEPGPERIRSIPAERSGCSASSNNWFAISGQTTRQFMPSEWQYPLINGFHHANRCRRPAIGCSVITQWRNSRRCSRQGGDGADHRCGEQMCCYIRGMIQTNRHKQDGKGKGSGEARGIHGPGQASATWLEGSESKLELSMG